jgi:ATP-dependent RNA helicase SUPV3L1/SUV3
VQARIDLWLANHTGTLLKPLFDLSAAETLSPAARGIAFRLSENLGIVERSEIADEVKSLDQDARSGLRNLGVRFGAYHIYVPALLKPAPSALIATLWALKNGGLGIAGLAEIMRLAASGRTSVTIDPSFTRKLYPVVGYKICGTRAVRIDILERLADMIRPLIAWRPTPEQPDPPPGAINGYGFTTTVAMTSLLGCAGEDFAGVLKALGYRVERKPAPVAAAAMPAENAAEAASAPAESAAAEAAPETVSASESTIAAEVPAAPGEVPAAAPDAVVEPAAPTAAAEPQFIEIWRPGGRRDGGEHRRPVRGGGHPARRSHTAPPADAQATAGAAGSSAASAEASATAPGQAEDASGGGRRREDRRDHGQRDREREGERGRDRSSREHRRKGRAAEDGDDGRREHRGPRRDDRRPQREGRGEPLRFSTETPKSDKRAVDPNSPFAALAALKARLEGKERDS